MIDERSQIEDLEKAIRELDESLIDLEAMREYKDGEISAMKDRLRQVELEWRKIDGNWRGKMVRLHQMEMKLSLLKKGAK